MFFSNTTHTFACCALCHMLQMCLLQQQLLGSAKRCQLQPPQLPQHLAAAAAAAVLLAQHQQWQLLRLNPAGSSSSSDSPAGLQRCLAVRYLWLLHLPVLLLQIQTSCCYRILRCAAAG
jgi:hypothetical protein